MAAAGGVAAAGAAGAAASSRSFTSGSASDAIDTDAPYSDLPPPPSERATPIAPNGPDDHFGPPEEGADPTPTRQRDPWPEKPEHDGGETQEAVSGKRDLLIGLGLIALAGLVAGGVILLNWNRDRDAEPLAGDTTTTTIDSAAAVAALSTTTTTPPVTTTTPTTTPPIPTTTIPTTQALADFAAGDVTSVAFDSRSTNVSLGAALLLDELAAEVNETGRHVLIQGFAAPGETADEPGAVILSLARANAIKAALVDRDVDPDQMTLFGCGSTKHPSGEIDATSEVLMQFAPAL